MTKNSTTRFTRLREFLSETIRTIFDNVKTANKGRIGVGQWLCFHNLIVLFRDISEIKVLDNVFCRGRRGRWRSLH